MSEQFVPLRGNKKKPRTHTHTHKIKLLWWQREEKLPIPDACLLKPVSVIQHYICPCNWSTLRTTVSCDEMPRLGPCIQSPPTAACCYSLTYHLHPQHCSLILLGHLGTAVQSPIYYLVNIMFRSKEKSKWSKNRGKKKSLTRLLFVLYSTSASYWKPAFLISQNALHAYMTTVLFSFWKTKVSHPKQLAEQYYNESALERHTN